MKINWIAIATRAPGIIAEAVKITQNFKVPGADKKAAVLKSLPEAEALIEAGAHKDIFNEPAIAALVSAAIDAEAAALKAREALAAGLLAKAAQAETTQPTP